MTNVCKSGKKYQSEIKRRNSNNHHKSEDTVTDWKTQWHLRKNTRAIRTARQLQSTSHIPLTVKQACKKTHRNQSEITSCNRKTTTTNQKPPPQIRRHSDRLKTQQYMKKDPRAMSHVFFGISDISLWSDMWLCFQICGWGYCYADLIANLLPCILICNGVFSFVIAIMIGKHLCFPICLCDWHQGATILLYIYFGLDAHCVRMQAYIVGRNCERV